MQKKSSKFICTTLFFESWIIGTTLGIAFLSVAGWLVFWQLHQNRILPAIFIENVDVGGLSSEQALSAIQSNLPHLQGNVTFSYVENQADELDALIEENPETQQVEQQVKQQIKQQVEQQIDQPLEQKNKSVDQETKESTEMQVTLSFEDIGVEYDYETAIQTALAVGRERSLLDRIKTIAKLTFVPYKIDAPVTYSPDKINVALGEIKNQIYFSPTSPGAIIKQSGNEKSVVLEIGAYGKDLDLEYVHSTLLNRLQNKQSTSINLNEGVIQTGYVLTDEEQEQALERVSNLVGSSIAFELPEFAQTPGRKPFKLIDSELIPLLTFPSGYDIDQITTVLQSWNDEVSVAVVEPELEIKTTQLGAYKVTHFVPPQNGLEIDIDKALAQIIDVLEKQQNSENTLTLPFIITTPSTELGSLNELGIRESLGLGVSHYRGSIPNRAFNVGLTAQRINNFLIAPGEEFSFNRAVGPISRETGFRSAYVIKDGRTVLGDGGGVCQVSTTIFRAALNAGLEITRRLQHSYRVSYYEQGTKPGLDATVYSGNVDLRFKNDTDHYILMHNTVDARNATLTTEFFGTSDGRSAEIISHEVWDARPAPAPQYFPDPNLAPGQVVQVDWAVGGVKTRVKNEIRDASGKVVRVDEYYSNYIPWSAKYAVGQ